MLIDRYNAFNFISSPVSVFDRKGDSLFTNDAYDKRIKGIQRLESGCKEGILFTTEKKGLVSCYQVSSDIDDIGNKICVFKEITPFVSRKSMTEIIASEDGNQDYALRKIIEKNLRMSSLIDTLESGVFVEGSSGSLIQVNNSFLKIISNTVFSELPTDEYNAEFYHNLLSNLVAADDYMQKMDAIVNDKSIETYIDEVKFKDGRVYTRTFKQLYVGDEPKGYLWKFKDITIRKELESFNIELEANLQALESNESVGIYMEYRGYKFVNKGLEQLLETDRDSLMCEGINKYIGDDIYVASGKDGLKKTVEFKRKDKSVIYIDVVADCISVGGSHAHVVTLKDNTETIILQKKPRKERKQIQKHL